MGTPPDEHDQLNLELMALFPYLRRYVQEYKYLLPPDREPLELIQEAVKRLSRRDPRYPLKVFLKLQIRGIALRWGEDRNRQEDLLGDRVQLANQIDEADDPFVGEVLPGASAGSSHGTEEAALQKEWSRASDDIFQRLYECADAKHDPKAILVLDQYLEGRKRREVAAALGSTAQVDAALKRLKRMLEGLLNDDQNLQQTWKELLHAPE